MAGIQIPENHFNIGENLIGYAEDFHGMKVNIRKTYAKDGEDFVGKGLCMSVDDWNDISANWEDLTEYINKKLNNG